MRFLKSRLAAALLLAAAPLHAAEPVTLNLVDADIAGAARTLATITHRNIVVDPRVKGTITLATDSPVPPAVAFDQFVATLRAAGYAVVDAGGLLKIVPEAEARLQAGPVAVEGGAGGSQIATQIFRLNYESAANLVPVLRPLISPNNTVNINAGSNALVITDYADNLQRLGRIIAALDVPHATGVEVIRLQHALAPDLAPVVQKLLDAAGDGAGLPAQGQQAADGLARSTVVAEPRSNALLARAANPARLALLRTLVGELDQPDAGAATGNIHVVYLRNAEAARLATVLRAALASSAGTGAAASTQAASSSPAPTSASSASSASTSSSSGSSTASTTAVQAAAQPSTGGQIQADPATNALIISAPDPQYRQLRAVIDQLDGRRAQVLVESVIVEVEADKAAEFSVQWQNLLGTKSSSVVGYVGTNYGTGGTNIISLNMTDGSTLPSTGFNFGIGKKVGDTYLLGLLARFFESTGDSNVLSTPSLLTLDNEEAKIVVGQNVPFVTGTYTTNSTSSSNPFQTVERKDVGLTLRVRPQISENGTIRMTVYQEVSSVDASTTSNSNGPTTNKRTIESTVLVEDGGIVVLGGLLQDQFAGSQEKVPGLSSVPVLGNLFRAETRSRKKTNLMVFLRPVVVRDAAQARALSLDRYDMMRAQQQGAQPVPSKLTPVEGAPVLP
ncbi:type II secretion system secretin GspD [Ramlibacter sp. G-1-2-2]|uniref:Type II secretion system secretin GspD n=1 Tax=Ramlibacter agri TaxID=2728837 RepID=A0A848H0X8_9BURK|nr:type II secretion system secretin GspD [Ramlibacter agri]NML44117.1 type II secretion system secretin GspD [Ramlibacter agri]